MDTALFMKDLWLLERMQRCVYVSYMTDLKCIARRPQYDQCVERITPPTVPSTEGLHVQQGLIFGLYVNCLE